jgi:hypothetical protein
MLGSVNKNGEKNPTILLNKRLCQTEKELALFHEIIHTINGEIPEQDVEFLAQTFYQVLRDNSLLR